MSNTCDNVSKNKKIYISLYITVIAIRYECKACIKKICAISEISGRKQRTATPRVFCDQLVTNTFFGRCIATSMWGTSTTSAIFRSPAREVSA